jgi:hypothetical protein
MPLIQCCDPHGIQDPEGQLPDVATDPAATAATTRLTPFKPRQEIAAAANELKLPSPVRLRGLSNAPARSQLPNSFCNRLFFKITPSTGRYLDGATLSREYRYLTPTVAYSHQALPPYLECSSW